MAASLGLTTVAEGIDTAGQKQLLTDLGCQTGRAVFTDVAAMINSGRLRHFAP